jgi:formamidopyrimidine-DNA glycosylase
MTGKWVVREPGEPPPRHSRARLYLSGGKVVHYNDPRLFGRIAVCRAAALRELPQIRALGPDPLHDGLEAERLQAALKRTRRAVKVALLDQRVLAGIGNILATEALFRARIHPARPASSLSRRQVGSLVRGLEASLRHTLASMTREGKDAEVLYVQERAGDHPFLVYGRAGEPCSRCREPIARMRLGGRATAFCPRCQRAG